MKSTKIQPAAINGILCLIFVFQFTHLFMEFVVFTHFFMISVMLYLLRYLQLSLLTIITFYEFHNIFTTMRTSRFYYLLLAIFQTNHIFCKISVKFIWNVKENASKSKIYIGYEFYLKTNKTKKKKRKIQNTEQHSNCLLAFTFHFASKYQTNTYISKETRTSFSKFCLFEHFIT